MLFSLGPSSRICLAALLVAAAPLAQAAPASAQSAGGVTVARYADALGTANTRLSLPARRDLAERLLLLSSYYKIDPLLLAALVTVESAWRSGAVSPVGALGYGQLMPGTAAGLRVDALEPYENLDGTARYLRRMLNRYAGRDRQTRMQLALASYNAGAGAVDRWHGIPPYRETRAYVTNVLRVRQTLLARTAIPRHRVLRQAQDDRVAQHDSVARHHRVVRTVASARASKHAHRVTSVDATGATAVALAATPPVRYETSHSFVARLLGLRHRVGSSSAGTSAPDVSGVPSGDY